MAEITKPKTRDLKHIEVQLIKNVELPADSDTPVCLVARGSEMSSCDEIKFNMTKDAFARAARGAGSPNPNLRYGLSGVSRFKFILLIGQDEEGKDIVKGIHCVPRREYLAANFASELNKRDLEDNAAVINVHTKTGEIDVTAFPESLQFALEDFMRKIEGMDTFDDVTTFTAGGVDFSAISVTSNEVIFRCFASQNEI